MPLSNSLRRKIPKNEVGLSPQAMYWARWKRDHETVIGDYDTFRDTIIVNPIFTPINLKKDGLLDINKMELYNKTFPYNKLTTSEYFMPDTTLFQEQIITNKLRTGAYHYIRTRNPQYFKYTLNDFPTDQITITVIDKPVYESVSIKVESDVSLDDVEAPLRFIPERRYWTSSFQSMIQFAQNYISPNWHKGGVSALNLANRQYFAYTYNKDKIQFVNELEWKTGLFTAPKDTLRDYKIGDDVFRIHSNIGYKAWEKWYYTFDFTFQTQLFTNYLENTDKKLAAFMSPFSINLGIGMKYDLNKTFANNKHKKVNLSVNLAPLSYQFMYSIDKNIDFGRHGFEKNPETDEYKWKLSQVGSTINATMTFQFNRNVSWYSRLYYFTSYDRILGEFENRLTMAISRFFSTNISVNLRYDDAVTKKEDFDTYLQINELLSFGFNYKW